MRSENLQKEFSNEYENFFLENNLIISIPHIIHRGYIFDKKESNPQIRQKIPNKIFIWINTQPNSTEVNLHTIKYFSSTKKEFIEVPIQTIFADLENTYFKEYIKERLHELWYKKGIKISVLSESERWSGVEFIWILPVLLSTAINILTEKVTIEQINNEANFENSPAYTTIYKEALKYFPKNQIDKYGSTSYAAMSNERTPTITKRDTNKKINMNIKDIVNLKENHNQPMIDYGIINFGTSYDEHYINSVFKKEPYIKGIWSYLNEKLLDARENILKHDYEDQIIDNFINIVQQEGLFWACVENHQTLFTNTVFLFNQTKHYQDEKIGIMPITSSKYWWSFIFVTKYKKSRETMEKLIEKLQEIWHKFVYYHYLSRIDWFTNDGIKIEQHIDKHIYSPCIKNKNAVLESYHWTRNIGNHRELLEQTENSIIFDTIDGKIYINQKPTNHSEIITQSGTIEIIKKLVENIWNHVTNKQFPPSSYSKNKNEMIGKIIAPLQELVQKNFNEKLTLKCSWSIVNFDIYLEPNNINLYILKQI